MSQYTLQTEYRAQNVTPAALVRQVFGMAREKKSITIHHWGSLGQRFETVRDYLASKNSRQVSAHYVVQDGVIARLASPDDATWHAGNAQGNATSIGLELRPEATDGDYATAAQLIRELRDAYGDLPLVPHNHWAATLCPGKWDLSRLDGLARGTTSTVSVAPVTPPAGQTPAPLGTPVNRMVTNPAAYVRTAPNANAPLYAVFPTGTPIAVIGYVGGQDPYGTGDSAWYKTKSGYYLWANAAEDRIQDLPYLGQM